MVATRIVAIQLVAISVPATVDMKFSMITRLALVRILPCVCMSDTDKAIGDRSCTVLLY